MDREGDNIRNPISGIRRLSLIRKMEASNAMRFNFGSIVNLDDQKLENIALGIAILKRK